MPVFDIDKLVSPIAEELPCGENLEYAPEFGELERASRGKAPQVMGDKEIEAEPPDWPTVYTLALELFERSLDLRLAVMLTRAALKKHGPEGMADGLEVFGRLVEQYWATVHPQLDEEDNFDPTLRLNSMLPLCDPDEMIADISQMELVAAKRIGKFSLRDWRIANGELNPPANQENVPDAALINAAFMEADIQGLEANSNHVVRAINRVKEFDKLIRDQVGGAVAPGFTGLINELVKIQGIYAEHLSARGVGVEVPDEGEAGIGSAPAPVAGISGEIQNRDDVVRLIDRICQFYDRAEPSSPVPMLLKRARRLVHMSFMEILQDLTPDGIAQARSISGVQQDASGDGY